MPDAIRKARIGYKLTTSAKIPKASRFDAVTLGHAPFSSIFLLVFAMTKTTLPIYRFALLPLFFWFLASLAGCATREKLLPADAPEQIELTTQVSYKSTAFSGNKWEYIALPGIYNAERKDEGGVYFYGPGRSIVEIGDLYKNVPRLMVGGLYVPNDKSQLVQMVWAFENTPATTDNLNQYVQDRLVTTTTLPQLRPGVGTGTNIVGHAVAGAVVAGILAAGEGEITRISIKDQATSDLIRAARRPKLSKPEPETANTPKP